MAKISVIVAAYNVEKYIHECIDSILAQTFDDYEVIIIDDGSSDSTAVFCDEYSRQSEKISVYHQTNGGVSSARNTGIKKANGEYICFIDGDDYISQGYLEKMYLAAIENDADVVICNYSKVRSDGQILRENVYAKNETVCSREALSWLYRKHGWTYVVVWNHLYKKSIFDRVHFPTGKIHEDEYVAHEVFFECETITSISDLLYFYRESENSITSEKCDIRHVDGMEALYNRFQAFEANGYTELLLGTLKASKQFISYINKYPAGTNYEKKRIKELKKMFFYMVKKVGIGAGYNWVIAIMPKTYYWLRNAIRS